MGEEPGGGQQRQVLEAVEFPDLLHVAGLFLGTLVDLERVHVRCGPAARHRVVEPVGLLHVGPDDAEQLPFALEQPVRVRDDLVPGMPGNMLRGVRRQDRSESPIRRRLRQGGRSDLPRTHLTARPRSPDRLLTGTPGDLGGRHPAQPPCVPAELGGASHGKTRSGRPVSRLSPTAMVARVVASRESMLIGIGAPVRTASTNPANSDRWPLS